MIRADQTNLATPGDENLLIHLIAHPILFRRALGLKLSMMILPVLANQLPPMESSRVPVLILILVGIGFAVVNVLASVMIGPGNTGPGKETTYESGMVPVGDTRKRFNVRFYVVAMIFLVFDVEIVFFYPWAVLFPHEIVKHGGSLATPMIISMGVFVVILAGGVAFLRLGQRTRIPLGLRSIFPLIPGVAVCVAGNKFLSSAQTNPAASRSTTGCFIITLSSILMVN